MSAYQKPLPRITPDDRPFWEAARRHELRLPQCQDCKRFWWPPSPVCPNCFSERYEWARVSGRGTISSWVVFHRAYFPSFANEIPYASVQIELEEGPRLISNLVSVPNEEIRVGMPVEVVFDDVTPEISIPRFRRLQ